MNPLLFGRNQFVNDRPFTFTTRRDMSNWVGDYLGLWITGGEMYAAWTDNRTSNRSHIFFAKARGSPLAHARHPEVLACSSSPTGSPAQSRLPTPSR